MWLASRSEGDDDEAPLQSTAAQSKVSRLEPEPAFAPPRRQRVGGRPFDLATLATVMPHGEPF